MHGFPDVLPAEKLGLHAFILVPNLNFTGKRGNSRAVYFFFPGQHAADMV